MNFPQLLKYPAVDRKRKFEDWKCKKNTSIKILKQNIRYYSYDQSSISDNQHTFSEKKYRVYLHIVYTVYLYNAVFIFFSYVH